MHIDAPMATPDEIKAFRLSLGENQTQFAARFGVDQSTISRWETEGIVTGLAHVAVESVMRELKPAPAPEPTPDAG